jgi:transmembrane sensor
VVVVGLVYQWLDRPDDYATTFGERRVVTLADGSKVSLDSGSEVTVRFTRTARELHLLRGQARFDVAHDVEKPFSVVARDQKVIATGTAFNIDITQPKVLVTLIEGHVVVLDENAPAQGHTLDRAAPRPPSVELHAGQQLAALPDKAPTVAPTDVQQVVAWTNGQLVFDDQPLSDVVARVNHYTSTPIILADDKAGSLRISGSFNTGDVAGFLDLVTRYLPVRQVVDDSGHVTLQKK